MVVKDILYEDDLLFSNGDFAVDASDQYHIQDIFTAAVGHYKQTPLLGAAVQRMLNGNIDSKYIRKAQSQLEADGYKNILITYKDYSLNVNANRV